MLRHAYLMGSNTSRTLVYAPDDWEKEREETISELIEEQNKDGRTCYNSFPCDCTKEELEEQSEYLNQMSRF